MKAFLALVKFYFESVYGLKGSLDGLKGSAKAKAKAVGIGVLMLYGVGSMGFVFVLMALQNYEALEPLGMQRLVLVTGVSIAVAMGLVLGLVTVFSTYYLSRMDGLSLALPLRPWQLLGTKFLLSYFINSLISFLAIGCFAGVYGIMEGAGFLYYLQLALVAIALPIVPTAASYLIVVGLVRGLAFIRKKEALVFLGSTIAVVLGVGLQVAIQFTMPRLGSADFARAMAGEGSLLQGISSIYPAANLAVDSLADGASFNGLALSILLLAGSLLAAAIIVAALGGAYAGSLPAFGEERIKRLKDATGFIKRSMASEGLAMSLLKREIRLMNREPVYFMNGPFIILMMPLIMGIMLAVQTSDLSRLLAQLRADPSLSGLMALIAAGAAAFLGNSTSVAATAFSREGANFYELKSLPIPPKSLFAAKFAHGMIFSAIGSLVGVGSILALFPLGAAEIIAALALSIGYSALFNALALRLDLARPKLKWDNPIVAMKQNMNGILAMLGNMGVIVLIGAAIYFLNPPVIALCLVLAAVFGASGAVALRLGMKAAPGRFAALE
jgi:ABC-2 type transport system permease protein